MLEHLEVELPLGVLGLGAEPVLKVCSAHKPRPKGICALAGQGCLHPWILGVPVTQDLGADVVASSPVILGMLKHLESSFLWVLWDWVWSQCLRSAQDTGSDLKEKHFFNEQNFVLFGFWYDKIHFLND